MNARYLNRAGLPPAAAAATVGVSEVAAFIVHVSLMLVIGIAAGTQADLSFNPPRAVIIGLGIVAMLIGGLASISHVRRWLTNRIRPMIEQVIPRLVTIAQQPGKLVEGFGGILLLNVAYCLCLVACVRAFSDAGTIAAICFVYLAGSTLGQAAPTPGGLGVVEAALAAGLAAAGVPTALAAIPGMRGWPTLWDNMFQPSSPRPAHAIRRGLTFDQFALALVVVLIAAVTAMAPWQSDTYWHLRAGQDIWTTGEIPLTDTYTHTIPGNPWPNHSWLWQATAYAAYSIGGHPLPTLITAAAATAAVAASLTTVKAPARQRFLVGLVAFPVIAPSISVRPQVLSLLFLALLIRLIAWERFLWIPALFLVWANTHAAVSTGGYVLVAALVIAAIVWAARRNPRSRHRLMSLSAVTVVSAVVTLVNPLGAGLWTYVMTSIPRSRAYNIQEWQSALHLGLREAVTWALVFALVGLTITRHRAVRTWPALVTVVIALSLIPLALVAIRNAAFLGLAAIPAMLALGHFGLASTDTTSPERTRWHVAAAFAAAGLACLAVGRAWSEPASRLGWEPVPSTVQGAVAECPGPLYNTYNDGGFLIWEPGEPVFVDSRQDPFPSQFIVEAHAVEVTGAYRPTFDRFGIGCAAVPAGSGIAKALEEDEWVRAAADEGWLVLYAPSTRRRD